MKTQSIMAILRGRLVQLMIVAISAAVLLLSAASLYLTYIGFGSLKSAVTADLRNGQKISKLTLEENLVQVSESVASAQHGTATALSEHLNKSMAKELSTTEETLHASLMETADVLATMLAEVAPEAILGMRFDALVGYTKVANRNRHVVYAVYVRPNGRPYTRYVDRSNPLVIDLLGKSEGRTPLDRLLSAAEQDPNIREINREIRFDERLLGSIRLGFSITDMNARIAEMQARFDTLIDDTNSKTRTILDSEASSLISRLDQNFKLVNQQHAEAAQAAEERINHSARGLIWNQIISTLFVGFVILFGLCLFFILRVIKPLNRLTSAMQDIAAGEGDLTRRLPDRDKDEITRVAVAFNRFVGKIQQALAQASRSTTQLSAATDVLAEIARQSDDNVNTQQIETQQVALAITQMARAVREISRNAESAAAAAQEANSEADVGKQAMLETGEAIKTLAKEVHEAA